MPANNPLFDALLAERATPIRRTSTGHDLHRRRRAATPIEQNIADERGVTVAQLIHGLLDDETLATRRWPFHPTR